MNQFFKPSPLKIFTFVILFLLLLSTEPSDISFKSRGSSIISILKALVSGINLKNDTYFIIFLILIISYLIVCLVFYIFSEKAVKVFKRPSRKRKVGARR